MKTPENSWIIVDITSGKAIVELYSLPGKLKPQFVALRPSEYLPILNKKQPY